MNSQAATCPNHGLNQFGLYVAGYYASTILGGDAALSCQRLRMSEAGPRQGVHGFLLFGGFFSWSAWQQMGLRWGGWILLPHPVT